MTRSGLMCAFMLGAALGGGSWGTETVREERIAAIDVHTPEQVEWSPSGDAVWASWADDVAGVSFIGRYPVDQGSDMVLSFEGLVRAFWVSPDQRKVASIHEAGRERVLQVWETANRSSREIDRDTWSLYFPLVNTVTPWDASSERLLHYRAWTHWRKLCLWDPTRGEVSVLREGRRLDRAFWGPSDRLLIPQGNTLEQVQAGEGDEIHGFEELDPRSGEVQERTIPQGYSAFFPFPSVGVGVLKDPIPPPLALNLRTWETKPLPQTIARFLEVAWAPSGNQIAFPINQTGMHRIEAFDLDTGESRLVWIDPASMVGSVVWSPSGKYVGCSLLEATNGDQERLLILDAVTGERIWETGRNAELGKVYYRRGRKSLLWHPREDRLLYWERLGTEAEGESVEFRVFSVDG